LKKPIETARPVTERPTGQTVATQSKFKEENHMNGKTNRPLRTLAAAALAFAVALSGFMPVWADGPVRSETGTAAITKVFQTTEGTTVPEATFEFTAEKVGIGREGNLSGMPDLGNAGKITVALNSADDAAAVVEDGVKTVVTEY
jgi:hypothetical protein